jgi:hypothetical protein
MMLNKNKMNNDVINNKGSVEDIRCSLSYCTNKDMDYLKRSLEYEPEHKNRSVVIKMLQAKIRKIEKLLK